MHRRQFAKGLGLIAGVFGLGNLARTTGQTPTTKEYIATLITESNEPFVSIKKNTFGDIVWARNGTGLIFGTLEGAFINAVFSTPGLSSQGADDASGGGLSLYALDRGSDDYCILYQNRLVVNEGIVTCALADGITQPVLIEIFVYP